MKKILFILTLTLLCMNMVQAQVNIGGTPLSFDYEKAGTLTPLTTFEEMPPIDMAAIEAEDAQWESERLAGIIKIGRRFGIEFEVDYDLHNSGIWTNLPDGGKLWRLGVECPGALSINLIFDQYRLPKGATLYIYSADKQDKIGGFTDYNNQADNFFAADLVSGDKIIIEYYQPANAAFDGTLRLATIVHGYRGLSLSSKLFDEKGFGQAGYCQRNTICPEGEGWENQIKSVFALYSGSTELCTGTILNNTSNDKTPYALTANHCWQAAQNPGIWIFRFNWESPTCTPTANSSYHTMSGSVLRMKTATSTTATDCCLVELNQPINPDWGVYYAGWSRATTAPPSVMCIHHPQLDIKKITPSSNVSAVVQYVKGWRANWAVGGPCTDPGSSGSPLFDNNGRVIGQEYGGESYCGGSASKQFDVYGRFDISWDGTAASNRLKDWLDPLNLDPQTLDGTYGNLVADAELNAIIVPEAFYASASTIEPKVTVKNSGNLPITSATVSYTIDGGAPVSKTWEGTLSVGATVDITFDAIQLTYGAHVFEATVAVTDDGNSSNNMKTKNFEVVCVAPVNLVAAQTDCLSATLTWEDQEVIGELSGYNIYRNNQQINEALITEKEYLDENLETGAYIYQVSAKYEDCESDLTNEVSLVIQPCEMPQNLQVELVDNFIFVSWAQPENINNLLGYNLYRNEEIINAEVIIEQEYEDMDLVPKTEYCYQVSAVYSFGESDQIESKCVFYVSINDYQEGSFSIYPNPTTGVLNLIQERITNYELGITNIEIYDIYGKKMNAESRKQNANGVVMNISNLPAGIYFVKIFTEDGEMVKKVIKM